MIKVNFEDDKFFKEMTSFILYSEGYLEGAALGKPKMLQNLGNNIKELAKQFVDSQARSDPQRLHHVYEWYQTGSSSARLFDIHYSTINGGLTFNSTFRQSTSFSRGSTSPFYDKARIMEQGIPVTIAPKQAKALMFDENGETVFVKGPITIDNPGGDMVQNSFEDVLEMFFATYLTQSFLLESGFTKEIQNPQAYKDNLSKAKTGGKTAGRQVGYNWIVKAGGEA